MVNRSASGPGRTAGASARRILLARPLGAAALVALATIPALGLPGDNRPHYYSTAAPPREFAGPRPDVLAPAPAPRDAAVTRTAFGNPAEDSPPERTEAPRVAATVKPEALAPKPRPRPDVAPSDLARSAASEIAAPAASQTDPADPIALAKKAIADCRARYAQVHDYTCTFHKRERIDGRLSSPHVMTMKARTRPYSVYFKFQKPTPGREAIYVAGQHGGRVLAHDVGLGKLVAGTLQLDPKGSRAMEDNRHPITESGLGNLIETVHERWQAELRPSDSVVTIHPNARVGNRPCTMVESTHPTRQPGFMFHKVKLYIDRELGLPIRFEAYDWPRRPGQPADLVEEYTYTHLRVNTGLSDQDFDPANPQYAFGRF